MSRERSAYEALDAVVDPELDEPITDLGFVRSLTVGEGGEVEVHLRLPTSFCAPNFAYLMVSDAKDALTALPWTSRVVVELDDHHDSELINAGLAADAGYRGTFRHEAEQRSRRAADDVPTQGAHGGDGAVPHRAAARRPVADGRVARRGHGRRPAGRAGHRRVAQAAGRPRAATARATSSSTTTGRPYAAAAVPMALRRARSTRISIDGNAHFCRGLLRTRYADEMESVR